MVSFRSPQVILFSADVERAAAFYRSFGFSECFRTPDSGEPIHVDLELDGMRFGIASIISTRDDHGLSPVEAGQRAAVILWCDDVDAALALTATRGIPTLAEPVPWLERLRIAWIADPDGHPVQLVQRAR